MSEGYEERAHKQIQIESWSNSARTLLLRGSTTGGPFAESHTTNADRSRATDTYELHGIPTKLQVSPSEAPVRRGECYVRVTLLLDGEPVQRLSAAYLTDSKTLSWPPGQFEGFTEGPGLIRVISGTNPAANVEVLETVPTNAAWKLKSVMFTLVTDANAANRGVMIAFDDGTTLYHQVAPIVAHAASETRDYVGGVGMPPRIGTTYLNAIMLDLPDLIMAQGHRWGTNTINRQAGDDYGVPAYQVEEWIEE